MRDTPEPPRAPRALPSTRLRQVGDAVASLVHDHAARVALHELVPLAILNGERPHFKTPRLGSLPVACCACGRGGAPHSLAILKADGARRQRMRCTAPQHAAGASPLGRHEVIPVPAQMWKRQAQSRRRCGANPVPVQMWQGRTQSRCRCGRGEPSPGVNAAPPRTAACNVKSTACGWCRPGLLLSPSRRIALACTPDAATCAPRKSAQP